MLGRRWQRFRDQSGLTVIELLVVVAVAGMIGTGVAAGITHMYGVTSRNSDHAAALTQVRNAGYWIRRDARMAQTVQVDAGASGFPLTLSWVAWDGSRHDVTYAIEQGQLQRRHSIDGGAPSTLLAAEFVDADPAATNCQFAGGILTVKITVAPGGSSVRETEEFTVKPRPAQ
jgi:type II secretory pathway pseudopilin PulG